jgi:hypothetical protein
LSVWCTWQILSGDGFNTLGRNWLHGRKRHCEGHWSPLPSPTVPEKRTIPWEQYWYLLLYPLADPYAWIESYCLVLFDPY